MPWDIHTVNEGGWGGGGISWVQWGPFVGTHDEEEGGKKGGGGKRGGGGFVGTYDEILVLLVMRCGRWTWV